MMSIQLTLAAKTEVGGHGSEIGSHWEENLCIVLERTTLFIGVFYCSFFVFVHLCIHWGEGVNKLFQHWNQAVGFKKTKF